MALSFLEQFNLARRASAPLIAVRTPDIEATIKTIALNKDNANSPMILHDCVRGLTAVNDPQGKALVRALGEPTALANPVEMLVKAMQMPKESILFMANLHRFFQDP